MDFFEFRGFKEIKDKMGIPKNYYVEFDEKVEIKKTEFNEIDWKELNEGRGLDIDLKDIRSAPDGTLEYKGTKIALYIRDQEIERDYKFHVAWCETLENMDQNKRLDRYVASRKITGIFNVNYIDRRNNGVVGKDIERKLNICKNCLKKLNYKGYAIKNYPDKNKIYIQFSLEKFLREYDTKFKKEPKNDFNTAPLNIYPNNWSDISYAAREKVNWICQGCGRDFKSNKQFLHVHHIDGIKGNVRAENLKVLCNECHAKEPYHIKI